MRHKSTKLELFRYYHQTTVDMIQSIKICKTLFIALAVRYPLVVAEPLVDSESVFLDRPADVEAFENLARPGNLWVDAG
jgi:hypothetical protein